jgi:hypothetical protein
LLGLAFGGLFGLVELAFGSAVLLALLDVEVVVVVVTVTFVLLVPSVPFVLLLGQI